MKTKIVFERKEVVIETDTFPLITGRQIYKYISKDSEHERICQIRPESVCREVMPEDNIDLSEGNEFRHYWQAPSYIAIIIFDGKQQKINCKRNNFVSAEVLYRQLDVDIREYELLKIEQNGEYNHIHLSDSLLIKDFDRFCTWRRPIL